MSGKGLDSMLPAPTITADHQWLGTTRNLSLEDLRGHLVLLEFFTYCSVNCLHTLQLLKGLEKRHRDDPFTVLGIHSSKFDREKDPAAVKTAMEKYDIRHPMVMDPELDIWRTYGIAGWPTLVMVDARGKLLFMESGEPDPASIEEEIADLISLERQRGLLAHRKLAELSPADPPEAAGPGGGRGPLRFPGRVIILADGALAIADSGHNRLVITEEDGTLRAVVGSGMRGMADGERAAASFNNPQGMSADGDHLYVADAGNHLIRRVHLPSLRVETVAGDGDIGRLIHEVGETFSALDVALRSPWDVEMTRRGLAIAMAGSHQVWLYEPDAKRLSVFSGSGHEDLLDGAPRKCGYAQPTGLALHGDDHHLLVCDSESSAIRLLDLETGKVSTLVGRGLFTFGLQDGTGPQARLQHPMGISSGPEGLIIADTFNGRIRHLDPLHRTLTTKKMSLRLNGEETEEHPLTEPEGLVETADGRLVVCDTNNHRLLMSGGPGSTVLSPFTIRGLEPPAESNLI